MSTNNVPEILRSKGISAETVKALSSFKNEPGWLTEKRLDAWGFFEKIPMPTLRDEAWRYTDISDVRVENFMPYTPSPDVTSEEDLPEPVQTLIKEGEEHSRKGVILTDLHTALEEHEDLVKEKLFGLVPLDYDKFAALNAAAVSGGSFLYVPRGVDVEVPIQSYHWLDVAGSVMPRTLVVVEEGASVTYIDEYASAQNWERNVLHFNTIRSSTGKDATVNSLVVSLGSQLSRTNVEAGLVAEGSDSEMLGMYFADSDQVLDHHTLQDHISPNAHSDLLYKGALRDESLAVFSGLIRVEPGAQKTDAYQTNRNLILGTDEAMAVSLPNLEIMADDVKCSHGSTTGQVDDVELFYLMSRGIPRKEAEKLVVFGFFGEVTSRVPFKGLKQKLDRAIEGKIGLGFEERVA